MVPKWSRTALPEKGPETCALAEQTSSTRVNRMAAAPQTPATPRDWRPAALCWEPATGERHALYRSLDRAIRPLKGAARARSEGRRAGHDLREHGRLGRVVSVNEVEIRGGVGAAIGQAA